MSMLNLNDNFHFLHLNFYAIKSIPLFNFLIWMGILSLFALYFFYQWYKNLKFGRVIADTPTAKIRSAAQGYVELLGQGHRLNGEPSFAPLSKLPCIWYRYAIERRSKNRWFMIE